MQCNYKMHVLTADTMYVKDIFSLFVHFVFHLCSPYSVCVYIIIYNYMYL